MTTRILAVRHGLAWHAARSRRPTLADAPTWAGLIAAVVGSVVLLGWILDVETLKSMLPGLPAMKANTAICFVLMGAGMVLLARVAAPSPGRTVGLLIVAAGASIALLTGAQYVTGVDFGIDQLLFRDQVGQAGTGLAGRMAPLTTICLILLGLAMLAARRAPRLVVALSGVTLAVSILNVFDFLFAAAPPSFLAGSTQMAISTAVAVTILAGGVLASLGPANPFVVLNGRSSTALLWRQLFAASVVAPVVLSSLRLEGQRLGLYDTSYGTSLMLVAMLTTGVVAILRSARWANELETKREAAETERDRFFELSPDMLSVVGADGFFAG